MKLEFFGGPYDGNRVEGEESERFAPLNLGDCLLFPKGHAYGWIGEKDGVTRFKFIKTFSESERMVMKVCEFKEAKL